MDKKKKRKTHFRQVQTVYVPDGNIKSVAEQYEYLGYHTKVKGDTVHLYWGTKPKKEKTEEKQEKKERRSKTERRLGRKFSRNEN